MRRGIESGWVAPDLRSCRGLCWNGQRPRLSLHDRRPLDARTARLSGILSDLAACDVPVADARAKLELAEAQLERVLTSWDPPDWADLSHYGFHALENSVDAACLHLGIHLQKSHVARQEAAEQLHEQHGFDDVSELLHDLNETRKSESYGDVEAPELDPADIAARVEAYVDRVRELLGE